MLYLLLGDVGSGKTTACLSAIEHAIGRGENGYLLVPEQETVSAETVFADHMPPQAALHFEVTNFTRLSNTAFRLYGGLSMHYATPAAKALTMHKTMRELAPYLHQKSTHFDSGKILGHLDGLRALHFADITSEDLSQAAKKTKDQHLKEKLEDLSLISAFYHDALTQSYADAEDDLEILCDLLYLHRCFAGKQFFFDSFHSFTAQQYRVLEAILPYSDVTITLTLPAWAEESICFGEILETKSKLEKLAKKVGVSIKIQELGKNKRQKNTLLRHICRHIWTSDYRHASPCAPIDHTVSLVHAEDPFEAADYIAADILAKVSNEHRKFGEFTILCGDASLYAGILDVALRRASIPCFLSAPTNISVYEPIKMIGAAYAAVCGGYKAADVLAYLKCSLCGIPPQQVDTLALYVETWHIDGKSFVDGKKWNMHPAGYGAKDTDYSLLALEQLWDTKQKLTAQLAPLMESTKRPMSVKDHCKHLTTFLLGLNMQNKLEEKKDSLLSLGEVSIAADYGRLWQLICDALDELYTTLGDDEVSADMFRELVKLTFASFDIGRIPPARDEVTVGSAATFRCENKQHYYLFGLHEEEFPGKPESSRLFSEAECRELLACDIEFMPTMQIRLQKQLFYFYRALSAPIEDATLMTFSFDAQRNACHPTSALARVITLAGDHLIKKNVAELPSEVFFYHPDAALTRLGTSLDTVGGQTLRAWYLSQPAYALKAKMAGDSLLCDKAELSPETCKMVWGDDIALSQSKIDQYVRCPFAFHQKYVLHLNEGQSADFSSKEIGTFIHDLLEHFLQNHDITKPLSENELQQLVKRAAEDYLARITPEGFVHGAQMQHIFSRLCDATLQILHSLADEFAQSEFRPVLFELPIGFPGDVHLPPLTFHLPDGKKSTLRGFIDRVDAYVKDGDIYVRVVDYKTGKKKFSEDELADGINLQMLLYLNALLHADGDVKIKLGGDKDSRILPAGILYFSCMPQGVHTNNAADEDEIAQKVKRSMGRSGLFLSDRDILTAMDSALNGDYIPIKTKTDGSYHKNSEPYLKTLEEWQEIFDELYAKVCSITGDILSGRAEAKPLKNNHTGGICDYCAYKPQCRNAATQKQTI